MLARALFQDLQHLDLNGRSDPPQNPRCDVLPRLEPYPSPDTLLDLPLWRQHPPFLVYVHLKQCVGLRGVSDSLPRFLPDVLIGHPETGDSSPCPSRFSLLERPVLESSRTFLLKTFFSDKRTAPVVEAEKKRSQRRRRRRSSRGGCFPRT